MKKENMNKKDYGDFLKLATEHFLAEINSYIKEETCWKKYSVDKFNFDDVLYGDGYFIFSYGTNSVINFHIREIPGWLFGIWWDGPRKREETKESSDECIEVMGTIFTQYEDSIDKFKPSRSVIQHSICFRKYLHPNEEEDRPEFVCPVDDVVEMLMFLHNEPALAFCRDYKGWNYNTEYHTRAEAKRAFEGYKKWHKNKSEQTEILNNRMLDKIRGLFSEELEKGFAFINDRGENWSPRYEVTVNKDRFPELKSLENGLYDLSELYDKRDIKTFDEEAKSCEKISQKYKFWWFNPVSDCVSLVDTRRFNKFKKSCEATEMEGDKK